jgi:hypothetical protein
VVNQSIRQNKAKKLIHEDFAKFQSRGASEQFLSKNSLSKNFFTVPTIFTSRPNTLVDSGKQGELNSIFKILQNSNLGEKGSNFFENSPFDLLFDRSTNFHK